jgi:antitoxin ParD1/3/4
MQSRNVTLTDELDRFVTSRIESGRYENASEVVRSALRSLERDEEEHKGKMAALRRALDEGLAVVRMAARSISELKRPG